MHRIFFLLGLPLVLLAAQAQQAPPPAAQDDPLQSPACIQARQAFEAAQADKPSQPERIEQLRKQAAGICLGLASGAPAGRAGAAPPSPSSAIAPPPRPPTFSAPAVAPPTAITRPPVITSCDPGGCWDSNGTRLNRAGPNLIGPTGLCTVQGVMLNCP